MSDFLYKDYDTLSKEGIFKDKGYYNIHDIEDAINPNFTIREYQKEAFARFCYFFEKKQKEQEYSPTHLLFNMATGSGKTLTMAMCIIELYKRGYRNFIFFVNSTNIVEKTKHNFINSFSNKYLFANTIYIDGNIVEIKAVDNFEYANMNDINIHFTTVQGLHSVLTTEKENGISYYDFKDKTLVLLADEAHHLSSETKRAKPDQHKMELSWESSILRLLNTNNRNLLLEFTATIPNESTVQKKYEDKLIYKYDLKAFRNDGYSKEVKLLKTNTSKENRILIACLCNYYRAYIASRNRINLKPILLLKSSTINESKKLHEEFITLIQKLNPKQIKELLSTVSNIPILANLQKEIVNNNIDISNIITTMQRYFKEAHCINMNNNNELIKNQILVNSLEDSNNPIRAIFAVDKLNEGWDVLNLFDIVRCYESNTTAKETTKEAQLIGRGARYFPFTTEENQEKYKRKYDRDLDNELRILEEFHYHAQNDSVYITNLNKALVESGILDEKPKQEREMKLKNSFIKTHLYETGKFLINRIRLKNQGIVNQKRFNELPILKAPILLSPITKRVDALENTLLTNEVHLESYIDTLPKKKYDIKDFDINIIKKALAKIPYYSFKNLKKYIIEITSINGFIDSYLAEVKVEIPSELTLKEVSPHQKLNLLLEVLIRLKDSFELDIKREEGTPFQEVAIKKIFPKAKKLLLDEKESDYLEELKDKDWYAYDRSYLTSEETNFYNFFTHFIEKMRKQYKDIYLLRNERFFAIYDKEGKRFEPDFVLLCHKKNGEEITYQCFIEPKGEHLLNKDSWKEKFMISNDKEIIEKEGRKYKIIGLPFYNRLAGIGENKFEEIMSSAFDIE